MEIQQQTFALGTNYFFFRGALVLGSNQYIQSYWLFDHRIIVALVQHIITRFSVYVCLKWPHM